MLRINPELFSQRYGTNIPALLSWRPRLDKFVEQLIEDDRINNFYLISQDDIFYDKKSGEWFNYLKKEAGQELSQSDRDKAVPFKILQHPSGNYLTPLGFIYLYTDWTMHDSIFPLITDDKFKSTLEGINKISPDSIDLLKIDNKMRTVGALMLMLNSHTHFSK